MATEENGTKTTTSKRINSICVFCGSSPGNSPVFVETAQVLGKELAKRGIHLVYGGGNIGVMGAVSLACAEGE
jgi:predicted Rossmann-fold nucleotide-binding protein